MSCVSDMPDTLRRSRQPADQHPAPCELSHSAGFAAALESPHPLNRGKADGVGRHMVRPALRLSARVVLLAIVASAVLTAAPASQAQPTGCGRPIAKSYVDTRCSFVATGTRAFVQASSAAPFVVTYSLLTPVFVGLGSVHAKLMMPNGAVIAECRAGGLAGGTCRKETAVKIPRGTQLTCWFEGYSTSALLDYLCSSRNPANLR